jgi:hypothetical protein
MPAMADDAFAATASEPAMGNPDQPCGGELVVHA